MSVVCVCISSVLGGLVILSYRVLDGQCCRGRFASLLFCLLESLIVQSISALLPFDVLLSIGRRAPTEHG